MAPGKMWIWAAAMAAALSSGAVSGGVASGAPLDAGTAMTGSRVTTPITDTKYKPPTADDERAARLRAAKGNAGAMANTASLLEQGTQDDAPDLGQAYDLYEKAADLNDPLGREKMCLAYLLGEGRSANPAKAMGYCSKLDDTDAVGLFSAGFDYDHGLSGPRDEKTALTFYAQAIKQGSGEAMDAVGQKALAAGNLTGARLWFRQATVAGSADGMAHLAAMIAAGQGGDQDAAEAYWLYVNAARRGNADAVRWVAALPATAHPLDRVILVRAKQSLMTEAVADKTGVTHVQPFNVLKIFGDVTDYLPPEVTERRISGRVQIHCYIDGKNRIDVCITEQEFPVGHGYGPIMATLFNGRIGVADHDVDGHVTAHGVMVLTFSWNME